MSPNFKVWTEKDGEDSVPEKAFNGIPENPFVGTLIELITLFLLKLINGTPDSDDDLYQSVCSKKGGFLAKITDVRSPFFDVDLSEISYTWNEIIGDCRNIQSFFLTPCGSIQRGSHTTRI